MENVFHDSGRALVALTTACPPNPRYAQAMAGSGMTSVKPHQLLPLALRHNQQHKPKRQSSNATMTGSLAISGVVQSIRTEPVSALPLRTLWNALAIISSMVGLAD